MAAIRSRGNRSTEMRLIALMRLHRIRGWRRGAMLPGRPDFVFPKSRLAVFVDGCFWHGCPQHGVRPKKNAGFWREKITRNRARDREVLRALRALDWRVIRIWEHALASKHQARTLARISRLLGRAA